MTKSEKCLVVVNGAGIMRRKIPEVFYEIVILRTYIDDDGSLYISAHWYFGEASMANNSIQPTPLCGAADFKR